jgi:hypothetical protein
VIPVEVTQTPWQFTTWLDLLDHWQTFLAGLIALVAAIIAVVVTVGLERRRERREADAILGSLAVEVRETLRVVTRLHEVLKRAFDKATEVDPISLKLITRLPKPTVYEASADKIGLLDGALARKVAAFFTTMDRIGVNVDLITNLPPESPVEPPLLGSLLVLIEQTCRRSLPLLDVLPSDEDDADLKSKIQGLSSPDLSIFAGRD